MATRSQNQVISINQMFYAPPFVVDIRSGNDNDGFEDYTPGPEGTANNGDGAGTSTGGTGTVGSPILPPSGYKIVSQTVRIAPDGSSVVDVVLEFPDQSGIQSVDVEIAAATPASIDNQPPLTGGTSTGGGGSTGGSTGSTGTGSSGSSTGSSIPQPVGPPGSWTLAFNDEFTGSSLDTTKWTNLDGNTINDVNCLASNVSVANGNLVLTQSDAQNGAGISSNAWGWDSGGYMLPVGAYAEARINFPGSGATIYNWPAWWTTGQNWPAAGEIDIAEGLGTMTTNYHSPSGAHNQGTVSGTWSNGFHTYGVYRKASSCDVYFDGVKVASYATDDNGGGQQLVLNVGSGSNAVYGAGSNILVDWVRTWEPA